MTFPHDNRMTTELVEVLKEWNADLEDATNALADALTDYKGHLDDEAEAAWEAMYDPERVAAQKHREATAHLDAFGRSLK